MCASAVLAANAVTATRQCGPTRSARGGAERTQRRHNARSVSFSEGLSTSSGGPELTEKFTPCAAVS